MHGVLFKLINNMVLVTYWRDGFLRLQQMTSGGGGGGGCDADVKSKELFHI